MRSSRWRKWGESMTRAIKVILFGIAVQGMVLATPQGWKTVNFKTASASEVQRLLASGASPNARDKGGETPLHEAAWSGNLEVIQVLLAAGASPNARGNDGKTPLHWAALFEELEAVQELLEAGADPNAKDKRGNTPLACGRKGPAGLSRRCWLLAPPRMPGTKTARHPCMRQH